MLENFNKFGIFRAYDIRGKYPIEINEEVLYEIVFSFISKLRIPRSRAPKKSKLSTGQASSLRGRKNSKFRIIVGHDARLSSPKLYRAAIKGIKNYELEIRNKNKKTIVHNSGFIILKAGMITAPMLYFLVVRLKADLGIMITASHNPKEYNGLKIVDKNAVPISGREIYKLTLS